MMNQYFEIKNIKYFSADCLASSLQSDSHPAECRCPSVTTHDQHFFSVTVEAGGGGDGVAGAGGCP